MSKKTVETIINGGNDYVIQTKRNQPSLHDTIQQRMVEQIPLDTFEIAEKGNGRHSFWSVSVFSAIDTNKTKEWQGLKRFIHVHKEVFYTSKKAKKKYTYNDRLYISSISDYSAQEFYKGIREHWGIENKLHWIKDTAHNEDKNGIRHPNGAVNNSIISTMTLNIHRANDRHAIKDSQIKFGANINELFILLNNT